MHQNLKISQRHSDLLCTQINYMLLHIYIVVFAALFKTIKKILTDAYVKTCVRMIWNVSELFDHVGIFWRTFRVG